MSKAILIIDMPDNCYECPLCYDNIQCRVLEKGDLFYFDRDNAVLWYDLGIDLSEQRLPHCPLINAATFSGEIPIEKNDND